MRVWAVSFFVFFGTAEIIHWLQGLTLPFAIYVIAGALLAIASNSEKWLPTLPTAPTAPLPTPAPTDLQQTAALCCSPVPPRYSLGTELADLDPNAAASMALRIAKGNRHQANSYSETNSFATDEKVTENQ